LHPFAYLAPTTVKEAVEVLNKYGDKARPLAGGTDLLVKARANVWDLDAVVDVKNIPELNKINFDSEGLTIGASVACCHIYENEQICDEYEGIVDAASIIGGIQIQSRAGLGGNLCNGAPSADGICPLIVNNAIAIIEGPNGKREVSVDDFCTGPSKTILENGELLVSIFLPKPKENFGSAYTRFIPRNEMDIAVAAVAASVKLSPDKNIIEDAKIALASVGPTPIVAEDAAKSLIGGTISDELINNAASLAKNAATPITDMRGTIEQRKDLVEVLTRRMITKSIERARG
tara:strand:- start:1531 stop:2400 length:870 start_codon:yes stop_codon:yes gene_type:complete